MIVKVERYDWGVSGSFAYDNIVVTLADGWGYLYDQQEHRWAKRAGRFAWESADLSAGEPRWVDWVIVDTESVPDAVRLAAKLELAQ